MYPKIAAWTVALAAAVPIAASAVSPDFATLARTQATANAAAGPRTVPGKIVAVPDDVSAEARALIAAPYQGPAWNANPASAEEWRTLVKQLADAALPDLAKGRRQLGVTMTPTVIGGVKAFVFMPRNMPEAHRNQLIINVHGGG